MTSVMMGEYALAGAMLTALAVVLGAMAYGLFKNEGLLRGVRLGIALMAGLLSVSCWGLLKALLDDNFAVAYVARHSEAALPLGYKVAAFWAGQEGSLLLWAWMIAVIAVVMAWQSRKKNETGTAITLAVMAGVTGFFTCVMLFAGDAGNPFEAAKRGMEAEGLNPVLQNWMMVLHPPLLFLGYAAYTAPFAMMLGALWSGERSQKPEARSQNNEWLGQGRGWMVFAWVALTVGIVLGSQWAYMVLGWGGYWGWDPVENASLLPWLTGTMLLHAALMQQRRGMFKRWTSSLTAASFFLCVFGTYLTRSGVVQSVHTFGDSPIGTFFLVFLCAIGVVSLGTILWRLDLLQAEKPLEDFLSREGMFLGAAVLLSLMTGAVVVGTMYEKISGVFGSGPITVGPAFYNKFILPMALLLAAMMATGPVLGSGAGAFGRVWKKLLGMAVVGLVLAGIVFVMGYHAVWAAAVAFTAGAVVAGVAIDVTMTLRGAANAGLWRVISLRLRHWGARVAHLGLAAVVVGVAGSSLYKVTRSKADSLIFKPSEMGTEQRVGDYRFSMTNVELGVPRENHWAQVVTIQVKKDGGESFELKPEQRVYKLRTDEVISDVAIRFGVLKDVYLNIGGIDLDRDNVTADGKPTVLAVAMEVFINPLVNWIWIGAGLMTLGGLICLIPGKKEASSQKPEARMVEAPVALAGQTARERRRAIQMANLTGNR